MLVSTVPSLFRARNSIGCIGRGLAGRSVLRATAPVPWLALVLLVAVLMLAIPTSAEPGATSASTGRQNGGRPARLARLNDIPTLEVDGAPFLLVGAQCDIWRSTRQDEKTTAFFDAYAAMNATAVSVGIPWSKTEVAPDQYDFQFMDWFIAQARQRRLKLVLNLFNSNVCGKTREGAGPATYPRYTPAYIDEAPDRYQRMVLPGPWQYDPGGPPMCPNDPRTCERERRLVVQVAEHLARTDEDRTVIMLQIDNEFYYQQWSGPRPAEEKAIRCHCPFCEAKWKTRPWKDGEEFMFHSFADYVRVLTDAITAAHPLPLYLNSPWWPPEVIPIFLERCPNLALVGIDGVFAPNEPNMLSRSQGGRNIPFASENPTENPKTRLNLDVLPYYSLVGQMGIGNLLWECGPPHTVVEDAAARQRYGDALYPIRWAQEPIARARGTEHFVGWYAIRDIAADVTTDVFGNFVPVKPTGRTVEKDRLFLRDGRQSRILEADRFATRLGDVQLRISDAPTGIVVRRSPTELVMALPRGKVELQGPRPLQATEGRFDRDRWQPGSAPPRRSRGGTLSFELARPEVIRIEH